MNKIAKKTTLWGKWFIIFASLILCVGMGASQASADVAVDSSNNNFTMIDVSGGLTGGTNDVTFTWDGTLKTSVAASGQVPNATIASTCPFSGVTWSAHDVAVYGPGTYTVYADCASGSPGCGSGSPVTFTVGATELGVHMLFNWGGNNNIDVVDVWTRNAVFGPSPMQTGACVASNYSITNSAGTTYTAPAANIVWDLMSKDWDGDGFNGRGMVDGPFMGFNANFNVMATPDACGGGCNDNNLCTVDKCNKTTLLCEYTAVTCDDTVQCTRDFCDTATGCQYEDHCIVPTEPILISPADGATGLGTTLELRWTKSTDLPQHDLMTYHITYCTTPNAAGCVSKLDVKETNLVKRDSKDVFYAGGAGLLMIGMTFIGGITGRKKIIALLIIVVLFAGGAFISCKNTKNADTTAPLGSDQVNTMVQGLDAGTTYYWRVEADNGYGMLNSSPSSTTAHSFTTR